MIMSSNRLNDSNIDAEFVLELQASYFSHQDFSHATTALATELAIKLGFERVSIGFVEQNRISIKAISHTADTALKYEVNEMLSAAMEEAIEQTLVITHPQQMGSQPYVIVAHAKLVRLTGNHVCSIPLVDNGNIFGAITIERNANNTFNKEEIAKLENISALIAPILQLRWSNNQSWLTRLSNEWSNWKQQNFSSNNSTLKIVFFTLFFAAIAALFIPINYNVSAPARLEGSIQRALVAPEDGYLQQAYVRPGDKVTEGQTLVALADQELLLEKRRWESELAQYENAYGASLAQSDRVQMAINQSRAEVARTELVLVEEKLTRSQILAPFDGVIIQGDLLQSLGAPLKRGDILLSIAPSDSYRLIIEVDERDIATIKLKQAGQVALISIPGEKISFNIIRITPVATSKEGRNFYEVEGTINTKKTIQLRPGLEGVAKIKVGKRPIIWSLTHRVSDWLKMTLWSWGF